MASASETTTDAIAVRQATAPPLAPRRVAPGGAAGGPATGSAAGPTPAARGAGGVRGDVRHRHVDRPTGAERGGEGGDGARLEADDAGATLQCGGDTGHEPATAHRDENGVHLPVELLMQLQGESALAG